jgi:RNA polymerase sigma factor (sigma-70 family)
MLADKSLVDDALQEAFAKLLRANRTFGSDAEAFRFIRTTVRNAAVDQYRRAHRRNRRFPSYDDPQVGEGWLPVERESPFSLLQHREEHERRQVLHREVQRGLRRLTPPQRQAIRLMFQRDGRPIKKSCARLGVPYSTVRSRMLAGIDGLRRYLGSRGMLTASEEEDES